MVEYTPSAKIMADGLTKALSYPLHQKFIEQLGSDNTSALRSRSKPRFGSEGVCQIRSLTMRAELTTPVRLV